MWENERELIEGNLIYDRNSKLIRRKKWINKHFENNIIINLNYPFLQSLDPNPQVRRYVNILLQVDPRIPQRRCRRCRPRPINMLLDRVPLRLSRLWLWFRMKLGFLFSNFFGWDAIVVMCWRTFENVTVRLAGLVHRFDCLLGWRLAWLLVGDRYQLLGYSQVLWHFWNKCSDTAFRLTTPISYFISLFPFHFIGLFGLRLQDYECLMKLVKEIIKLIHVVVALGCLVPWVFIVAGVEGSGD